MPSSKTTHPVPTSALRRALSDVSLLLLDLDGTTYVDNTPIPGALVFLRAVKDSGRSYVFLTNNSSRSAKDYRAKISRMGMPATAENVFTSGQATALHLTRKKKHPRVFLLGTPSLAQEFAEFGIVCVDEADSCVDTVVVGFDTTLTYPRLEHACALVDKGVEYIATHPDMVCPIKDRRFIPDCGSFCRLIEHATGRRPSIVFGKPDAHIVDILCKQRGVARRATVMVGDRLYTDIALGINAGITSICVLTGETTRASLKRSRHRPDFVINSIADLTGCL